MKRFKPRWFSSLGGNVDARCQSRGFTLVEMLVALSIFAAIASIGVGLLRASVDTQGAVQDRLAAMGAVNRFRALMANDVAHATLRATRGPDGNRQPAFQGDASGFSLVQRGRAVDRFGPQGAVQRVQWVLQEGEWRRAASAMADGSALPAGDAFVRKVESVAVRYRDARGGWRPSWSSDVERALPAAIEVTLNRGGRAPLLLRFQTGPALLPPVPEPQP